jgi:hypothetical protein
LVAASFSQFGVGNRFPHFIAQKPFAARFSCATSSPLRLWKEGAHCGPIQAGAQALHHPDCSAGRIARPTHDRQRAFTSGDTTASAATNAAREGGKLLLTSRMLGPKDSSPRCVNAAAASALQYKITGGTARAK